MTASTARSTKPLALGARCWLPCVAAVALLAAPAPVLWAQAAPQGAVVSEAVDPPGSIARLSLIEGAVSHASADAGTDGSAWTSAQLNRPLTSGDRLWTGEQSRTELHVGSTAIRLNGQTSLDFIALDDNTTQLRLAQGTVRLRVRQLFPGQRLEVDTPNLAFVISQPGDYRIDASPTTNTTRVVAQAGSGVIYGESGTPVNLGNQQQGNFTGTNLTPAGPGAAVLDSFDNWAMARDAREDQSVSARYVPRETVGYQQLDNYGDWSQDPSYGAVWLPRAVPANWAPYRAGHWSWIAPWGWTWVDDAPWGFAPSHYGRWARIGPRWAWVPGHLSPRPVYAPALVAFVGGSSGGVNWNISLGSGVQPRPAVGWFPLAPGEAFRPAYRVSPRYVTRVNNNIVVNNTVNVTNVYRYQRQPAAVTAVSTSDFVRGRAVRDALQPVSAGDLERAQVVDARPGRGALPQRPDRREAVRPVAAAALPPAAVAARPVVDGRAVRQENRADNRNGRDTRDARREDRPDDRPQAQPAPAATVPVAARPVVSQVQERSAASIDDSQARARRERQQREVQRIPEQESIGQRALREQAQRERGDARPSAPVADSADQARREQQQLQREQQRLQREQVRQADQQRRQNEESIGQRALREAAARDQQAARQQENARRQKAEQQSQERNQQRQAHDQAQRQQQEQQQQRAQPSEERQQPRRAGAAAAREARNEGQPNPNRQQ
ncbi:MAG: DUF6600 domain-containing protein [Pseudomonadota bacterium]